MNHCPISIYHLIQFTEEPLANYNHSIEISLLYTVLAYNNYASVDLFYQHESE